VSGGRTKPVLSQQRPDRRGAHPDAELVELPADPDASPSRVLPRHSQDQRSDRRAERWSARLACRAVGPFPSDERGVPAQQRLRRDEERCPPLPGEDAAGGGEQGPVERCEPGTAGLAARDPELVSDHQDFQVLGAVISAGRTSRRVSTRAVSESSNSIGRWYGVPGHGANAGFRAPHLYFQTFARPPLALPTRHDRGHDPSVELLSWPVSCAYLIPARPRQAARAAPPASDQAGAQRHARRRRLDGSYVAWIWLIPLVSRGIGVFREACVLAT
jgi:hypothetical protein